MLNTKVPFLKKTFILKLKPSQNEKLLLLANSVQDKFIKLDYCCITIYRSNFVKK